VLGMVKLGEMVVQTKADAAPVELLDRTAQFLNDGLDCARRDIGAGGVRKQGMQDLAVFVIHDRPSRL
jgi:hypothetical protein